MRLSEIVTRYNDCINRRDIDGLAKLIDDDYVFIDTAGTKIAGKQPGIETWKGFFNNFLIIKTSLSKSKKWATLQ